LWNVAGWRRAIDLNDFRLSSLGIGPDRVGSSTPLFTSWGWYRHFRSSVYPRGFVLDGLLVIDQNQPLIFKTGGLALLVLV